MRACALLVLAVTVAASPVSAQQPDAADSVGRLWAPAAVQERAPTDPRDNDAMVQELEGRMRCTCGCNLDVFTCRTTDFTCQTSPAMHRLVLARLDSGMTAEQVIAAFEAQYGQSILMAPPKRGFNWAAYVTPFIALAVGLVLLGWLMRSWARARPKEPLEPTAAAAVPGASPEEIDRLRRELERFEA